MRWAIRFLGILILLATLLPSETRAAARESICNPVGELEYSEECSQLVRLYRLGQQEFQSGGYENTLVYFKASLAISEKEIKNLTAGEGGQGFEIRKKGGRVGVGCGAALRGGGAVRSK